MRQVDIFRFWLPLFASWLLMTLEGPMISAAINRAPRPVVMLAAFGIALALEVAIESPIINLLATATALVRDRRTYLLLRRFTFHWMIALTAVSVAMAFTPLFNLVIVRLLGTPLEIAGEVRVGMRIMILWSAAIAWRRFLQGVLIHFGHTRQVARGTALRLVCSSGCAGALLLWGPWTWKPWSGIILGAVALMLGVTAEAAYATFAVRRLLHGPLAEGQEPAADGSRGAPLTYASLFRFHLPLATTAVITLLIQPILNAFLARLPQPTLSLAAWPVIFQATLMIRSIAFALPEAVIALRDRGGSFGPLRRFSLTLAAVSLGGSALFAWAPVASLYLSEVQNLTADVAALAWLGLLWLVPLGALAVVINWLRGLLIHARHTTTINNAMLVRLGATVALLAVSLGLGIPGITAAALALVLANVVEIVVLAWRARSLLRRPAGDTRTPTVEPRVALPAGERSSERPSPHRSADL